MKKLRVLNYAEGEELVIVERNGKIQSFSRVRAKKPSVATKPMQPLRTASVFRLFNFKVVRIGK